MPINASGAHDWVQLSWRRQHIRAKSTHNRNTKHRFSDKLHDLVSKCLKKDPEHRSSAVELLELPFFKSAPPPKDCKLELLEMMASSGRVRSAQVQTLPNVDVSPPGTQRVMLRIRQHSGALGEDRVAGARASLRPCSKNMSRTRWWWVVLGCGAFSYERDDSYERDIPVPYLCPCLFVQARSKS